MATYYKYLPHATGAVFAGGIGVSGYYAYDSGLFEQDPPEPGSDFKEELDEFLKELREWLESHFPGHKPPPGTPDPGTDPDSPTYQAFSTSSHQEGGSSFGQMFAHFPVELWALVAMAVVLMAVAYHYGHQQQNKSPILLRP